MSVEWQNHLFGICVILCEMLSHIPAIDRENDGYDSSKIIPIDNLLEKAEKYLVARGYRKI